MSSFVVRVILCSVAVIATREARAQACYDLEEVNVVNEDGVTLYTSWYDVNNHDQFVGNYCIDPNCNPVGEFGQLVGGVIYDANAGTFETFELPAPWTWVGAARINDEGVVVGEGLNAGPDAGGFVRARNGNIFFVPMPKATVTSIHITGINSAGTITGIFNDPDEGDKYRSFVYTNGKFTLYDATDIATSIDGSVILDINDQGDVAGQDYAFSQDTAGGFIDRGAVTATIVEPTAWRTGLWSISNRDAPRRTATGWLEPFQDAAQVGFVYRDGLFTTLTFPGSFDTRFHGTNDAGVLAGTFDGFSFGVIGWPCD